MNYCYLDTNIFHGKNKGIINFTNLQIKYITVLASYGICRLIVPEVMKIELYSHFKEKIKEFDNKVREIGLPTSLIPSLGDIRNTTNIYHELVCAFEGFLNDAKSEIIPMNQITIDASEFVQNRYDNVAPFTSEKQNEYQDLFIITALRSFINQHNEDRLIVFSKDKGFVERCKQVLPNERVIYYDDLSKYKPLDPLTDAEKEVKRLTQDYLNSALIKLEDHLQNSIGDSFIEMPCPYDLYELDDESVVLSNPVVESVDVFDEEIYAYVVCDCIFQASGKGINEEQSDYNWSTHRYNTLVRQTIEIYKKTEVRFIVNLFAKADETGTIYEIEDINDIEVSSDSLSSILYEEINAKIDSIEKQESPFYES